MEGRGKQDNRGHLATGETTAEYLAGHPLWVWAIKRHKQRQTYTSTYIHRELRRAEVHTQLILGQTFR